MPDPIIKLKILRYNPETDSEPHYKIYDAPYRADWVILDAINWIKDNVDGTISHRWSCKMGVCGSCGMNIDGTPKLSCHVRLSEYKPGDTIEIDPLANFPIIRDLVVDIEHFIHQMSEVKAWAIPKDEPNPDEEYRQTPAQLANYEQFTMCINCMLCYAACPVYAQDPSFIGPAAIVLAHRYNEDSRDAGKAERLEVISGHDGIWACTFVGECSQVCPKGVDPAAAIQRSKVATTEDWFRSLLAPLGVKR